jgi:hypothetical protein
MMVSNLLFVSSDIVSPLPIWGYSYPESEPLPAADPVVDDDDIGAVPSFPVTEVHRHLHLVTVLDCLAPSLLQDGVLTEVHLPRLHRNQVHASDGTFEDSGEDVAGMVAGKLSDQIALRGVVSRVLKIDGI